jgi:hypothetical protein
VAPAVGVLLVLPPVVVPPDLAGGELGGAELDDTEAGGLTGGGAAVLDAFGLGGALDEHAVAEDSADTLAAGGLTGPPLWLVPGTGVEVPAAGADGELLGGPVTGGDVDPLDEADGLGLAEPVVAGELGLPALGVGGQGAAAGVTPAV